ncbi:hypothetical protein DFH28DRAFT_901996 [Melampsora americana]|nr:hypothetical protein DFH28DRAFT_901996 [Melampsora americana]
MQAEGKEEMHRIIKIVQDKRHKEFESFASLLPKFTTTPRYLHRPGEQEAAAQLLHAGGLGGKLSNMIDKEAKWKWLQILV